jgi:hypothetical protein
MKTLLKTTLTALLALPMVSQATLLDVYNSSDLTTVIDQINTIDTAQTGAQHYDYTSASGHPTGVNLDTYHSNVWVHQDTGTPGNYSFGFIFSKDESPDGANTATFAFRIVGSDTDVFVSQSDDPGEATETSPGTFSGTFNYGFNTDGIMVSGITGTSWTIIIDSVDFGDVTDWFASEGEDAGFGTDTVLTLGEEYRITLAGHPPSGAPVGGGPAPGVPEPTTLLLVGLGLAGLGFARKRLH